MANLKKYFLYILIPIAIGSCKKYPDDQKSPHLESPEGRLCRGDWVYMHTYNTVKNTAIGYFIEGRISFSRHKKVFEGKKQPFNFNGTWELTNKKKNLVLTDDKGNATEYIINQLDHDHLAFSNDSLRFDFTPKEPG